MELRHSVSSLQRNVCLSIQVHKLSTVIQSVNDHDYVVSPDFPRVKGEDIKIFGIIGNDILQCFNQFSIEKA